jgi:DNA-binding CsgD family transcriptional regulator
MTDMRGERRRSDLTSREREVLGLVRIGLTNEEIAQRLGISPDTAKLHVSQILAKLGVATREEAAASIEPQRRSRWQRLGAWALGATALIALAGVGLLAWKVAANGAGSDVPPESVQVITTTTTPNPTPPTPNPTPAVTLGGSLVPPCGTAEEVVAGGNVTLAEAQMLVDACLRANTPGSPVSQSPGPTEAPVTYALQEPYSIVLSNGAALQLPGGSSTGEEFGYFAHITYITLRGGSVLYFYSDTWQPYLASDNTYVVSSDRADARRIVAQLAMNFSQYQSDYDTLVDSYLRDGLPEQSPVRTPAHLVN